MTPPCTRGGRNRVAVRRWISGGRAPEKAAANLRLLVDAGVDSIVDLTTPDDRLDAYLETLQVASEQAGQQIRRIAHPIPENSVIEPRRLRPRFRISFD